MKENPAFWTRSETGSRRKNYSIRTEEAYVDWIRCFVLHDNKRHPREIVAAATGRFLNVLASPNSKVTRSARRIGALRRKKHA